MTLYERIRQLVKTRELEASWTTSDLVAKADCLKGYTIAGLRTAPPNFSISLPGLDLGTGANVNADTDARYWRVGRRGSALLYSVRDQEYDLGTAAQNIVGEEFSPPEPDNTTVEAIVESDRAVAEMIGDDTKYQLGEQANMALRLLVERMHSEEPWDERLRNYVWKGRTFVETQRELADIMWQGSVLSRFIERDIEWTKQDQARAVAWATTIFTWGGTRQKSLVTWQKVRATLANAVFNRIMYGSAPMNSGYTKVASFGTTYLEERASGIPQVINDSRVATSLTCRLESIFKEKKWGLAGLFPGLGKVEAARGGTRPRSLTLDWPDAYQKWSGQFAATAVVLAIRDILNEDGFPNMPFGEHDECWTARGVEAVLFMDGY